MAAQRVVFIKQLWQDFEVTEADIKQPTPEFVLSFFEKMLEDLALYEFVFQGHQSEKVLNQVSIADGSRKVVVCAIFRNIFARIKGPQFGIEDIIEPDPKRFGRQVDILLNLVRYLEYHFSVPFNKVGEEMEELSNRKDDYLKETDTLMERRNEIAIEKKELSSQLKSGEKEKYTAVFTAVKGKTSELSVDNEKLNGIHEKCVADRAQLEESIQKEIEEIEQLKENIIQSPDAASREKIELMIRKKDLEERHAGLKQMAEEKQKLASEVEQLCSTMETVPKQIKDLAEKHLYSKNLEKGFHVDEVNTKKIQNKCEAAIRDYESTKQEVFNIKEDTEKLEELHISKLASLENDLLLAKRSLEEAEAERLKKGAEQAVVAQKIHVLKEDILSFDEQEKILEEHFLHKMQQIDDEADQFHQKIAQKIEQMERQLGMPPTEDSSVFKM